MEETDSTNEECKRFFEKNGVPEGGIVFASDYQSAGKGRRGRTWVSPKGVNIYFSLLIKPDVEPDKASMMTLLMGMAVAKAVDEMTEKNLCRIKWPNDIVIDGMKICGILTEMSLSGKDMEYVVIGTGINCLRQSFTGDFAGHAGDIESLTEVQVDRKVLLEKSVEYFKENLDLFIKYKDLTALSEEYNKRLVSMDKEVKVLDPHGEYCGISRGIDNMGRLVVECGDGIVKKVDAGDVSVRGLYGYV